ncbi:MAG: thioredoxin family protein, partial [Deferribacterales bacterium]
TVYDNVLKAAQELERDDITVEYVKDTAEISKYVMATPGVVIDEVVVHEGKPLPTVEIIKEMIIDEEYDFGDGESSGGCGCGGCGC